MSESRKKSFIVLKKSYNKTIIDFNFGRHENLSTFKSDILFGLAASVNIIEVNNCIMVDTCVSHGQVTLNTQ